MTPLPPLPAHLQLAYSDAPAYFQRALSYIGTKELIDGELNPQVHAWLANYTRFPDELINKKTAWCTAFLNAMLELSGLPSTHSAAASSYLEYGERCDLQQYAICVIRRGVSQFHVALCAGIVTDDAVLMLGANQDNSVCIKTFRSASVLECRLPLHS